MSRIRSARVGIAVLAMVATVPAACTEPALLPDGAADGGVDGGVDVPPPENVPDTPDDELAAQVDVLRQTVESAIEQLAAASEADGPPAARSAAEAALALLLDDPEVSSTTPALLPAESFGREVAGDRDDGLTALLTLARDSGGPLGNRTIEVLRDPIAGDLGAWERDAAGVVDGVRGTIAGSRDLDRLEEDIRELPGDATRALAWTMLAAEASDADALDAYVERGTVHLEFVLGALDQLTGGA